MTTGAGGTSSTVAGVARAAKPLPESERPDRVHSRRALVIGLRLLLVLIFLVGWQYVVASGGISESVLAKPTAVGEELGSLLTTGGFWSAAWSTTWTWAVGLLAATLIAVPLGLLLGSSKLAYRLSRFTVDFLRTIPPIALIPLVLLLFGATEKMALILVIFGSTGSLVLSAMYGVQSIDPMVRDLARSFRLRRRDVIGRILLPSAAPFIATGLRVSAAIALLLTIGAELIGGAPGLGNAMSVAQQSDHIPEMYSYVVASAVIGALVNLLIGRIEGRVLRWSPLHR
jgi:ABC-type nitrate/sulfonate/bicarbonate transport system permease component